MLSITTEDRLDVQHFRANPWKYQQTFKTPLKDLKRFVSVLLQPYALDSVALVTDEVVFEPKEVIQFLAYSGIELQDCYRFSIEADGSSDISRLIEAVLSDWIDFLLVPSPQLFAVYADHDEFTTFYAPEPEELGALVQRLQTAGFEAVPEYTRGSTGRRWR